MAFSSRTTIAFVTGAVFGLIAGCASSFLAFNRGPQYILAHDVPLRHGGGNPPSPVTTLHAGQSFDVYMRKGYVNYMRLYVISYDQDLGGHTLNARNHEPTKAAPWDRWVAWQKTKKGE